MKLKKTALALAALLAFALLLPACGESQPEGDPEAEALADELRSNKSTIFPYVSDLTDIPAPVSVIVKGETTYFLQSEALPIAAPAEAASVLLVGVAQNKDDTYSCTLTLGTPSGDLSLGIANNLQMEELAGLEALLTSSCTYSPDALDLLAAIQGYEAELEAKDYLTPINACRNDYDPQNPLDDLSSLTAAQVGEPMVYLMDEDFVCEPLQEGTLLFNPAEWKQYVPPEEGSYVRPEIAGPISLGISNLGRIAEEGTSSAHTVATVLDKIENPVDSFCFSEVIGTRQYGNFSNDAGDISVTAYSYNMRISVISLQGELLGYATVSYSPPQQDTFNLNAQLIAMTLSYDKNGTAVFQWDYKSAFKNELQTST